MHRHSGAAPDHSAPDRGFTLIELLIAIAIIGLLSVLAVPAYQQYTTRAKLTEVFGMASKDKAALAESYFNQGGWPESLSFRMDAGECDEQPSFDIGGDANFGMNYCPDRSQYISAIFTLSFSSDAIMHAYRLTNLNNDANGKWLTFMGQAQGGSVNWTCNPDDMSFTLNQSVRADGIYLPATCR